MTIGEVYDVMSGDKLLVVNKYDDGDLIEIYSSIFDDPLPNELRNVPVTFIDVIKDGLVLECNAYDLREV